MIKNQIFKGVLKIAPFVLKGLRIDFALLKWPHLYRAYLLASRLNWPALYTEHEHISRTVSKGLISCKNYLRKFDKGTIFETVAKQENAYFYITSPFKIFRTQTRYAAY